MPAAPIDSLEAAPVDLADEPVVVELDPEFELELTVPKTPPWTCAGDLLPDDFAAAAV